MSQVSQTILSGPTDRAIAWGDKTRCKNRTIVLFYDYNGQLLKKFRDTVELAVVHDPLRIGYFDAMLAQGRQNGLVDC